MIAEHLAALGAIPGVPQEPIDVIEQKFAGLRSLPAVGTVGLYAVIVVAGFALALALASARTPRLLPAARHAAWATCALVLFDIALLAYGFISHDFRIRYVARYSDRSMPLTYLFAALWGGQDGSLLWWILLLAANTAVCLWWMKRRWRELQPWVIATLMAIMMFFGIIMAFSANPFAESIAGARVDGEGLNPLLQNFYMTFHPPSLYMGFVACSVPFAFGIAALASGRLGEEWLLAIRRWMLFAWTFLGIGNALGMLWAYEELGWGGYWAWDPVENAAFMPWLTASAFVHSLMIQERRRMLKVWNILLLCQTFFMTIFGTFLTRSGMIASVHAFAQSNIGIYFTYFMVTIAVVCAALIVYRLPELKNQTDERALAEYRGIVGPIIVRVLVVAVAVAAVLRWQSSKLFGIALLSVVVVQGLAGFGLAIMHRVFDGRPWWPTVRGDLLLLFGLVIGLVPLSIGIAAFALTLAFTQKRSAKTLVGHEFVVGIDSVFSREAAFVANNWVLLAMQAFVLGATVFPLVSESVTGEKVTVGPAFYNTWMVPLGVALFALMGIAPLLGWRKTSDASLRKAFRIPLLATAAVVIVHVVIGPRFGFPAVVPTDPIYPNVLGAVLAKLVSIVPLTFSGLAAFNIAVVVQEFAKGVAARQRAQHENLFYALFRLVGRSRRRYGGYIVHAGIVAMFLGFAGGAYKVDQEVALRPSESHSFAGYTFTYVQSRREIDSAKMMIFADVAVRRGDKDLGTLSPAKFVYTRQQMPTSEVAIRAGLRDDVYLALGNVNSETKLATLHIYINPVTTWIWIGVVILVFGAIVATWPEAALGEVGIGAWLRPAGATAASLVLGLMLAMTPARAAAQQGGGSSLHAGEVKLKSDQERRLYTNLLCMCGECERLPLTSCVCDWAERMRSQLSARLAGGETIESLTDWYGKKYGTSALNVPPSKGFLRSVWLVPVVVVLVGALGAVLVVRRWARPADAPSPGSPSAGGETKGKGEPSQKDEYDDKLDRELSQDDHKAT